MKLVFDNIIYSLQRSGGGSVYWTELLKRFSLWNKDNIFFEQKEPNDNIFGKTLVLRDVRTESKWTLWIRRYLPFNEKIVGKHIFHSSYYRYSSLPNAINVTTIHDFTTERFRKGLAREINLFQKRLAVKKSKGIICISENTKRDLLYFVPNVDESKIKVIYNGVSDDFYFIDQAFDIKVKDERFNGLENYRYLLYIGHRTGYKNFNLAVEAASHFKDKYILVVIGEAFTEQEKQYVETHLGHHYKQISKLNNQGLNYLYNKAFVLLYPSSYEGFGIPVIEAMKTKCPVIAFKNSSIPEIAGDAGLLYEKEDVSSIVDGIHKLEDNVFRESVIEKGLKQSEKFNWDNTAKQYLEFYRELL
ncbi:glycosyltransferase family 4 protein [Lonepinella sp. BR2904]|uniref:glycosyltransferase family 4 protein n=1 Tax=Lonepinella sp. BR2904 TaxID=3434551 RepID=UPI003F6DE1A5